MKHLLFEVIGATEAAAIAAYDYVGSGDKLKIDQVATDAMRDRLDCIDFKSEVVIGEGIKDGSIGLFKGERIGLGSRMKLWSSDKDNHEPPPYDDPAWKLYDYDYDIAVDPVDGTTQTAKGGYEALSVIAIGGKGCLLPTEEFYMEKIAVGPKYNGMKLNFDISRKDLICAVEHCVGKKHLTVCMLDRPRHTALADEIRSLGCRIRFIQDCDISGAISTALPDSGIDLFMGIGGAPEGVITAAAMKCMGGNFIGRLVNNTTYEPIDGKVFKQDQLAQGDVMFAATGILNGSLLKGVRASERGIVTHSLLMESKTKSIKYIESYHGK